jgi:hypothetical protein
MQISPEYDQIRAALRDGHALTPRAKGPPQDSEYLTEIRKLVNQAVYAVFNQKHREASLQEVYTIVKRALEKYQYGGRPPSWRSDWRMPSKRTVDRRVNEAADSRLYADRKTPIVCVRIGYYIPNPQNFDGPTRTRIEKIIAGHNSITTELIDMEEPE